MHSNHHVIALDVAILEAKRAGNSHATVEIVRDILMALRVGAHYKDQGYAVMVSHHMDVSHVCVCFDETPEDVHMRAPVSHTVLMVFPDTLTEVLDSRESAEILPLFQGPEVS